MLSYDQDRLLHQLKLAWSKTPQLRLGQLLVNLTSQAPSSDPFYVTNERLENLLIMHNKPVIELKTIEGE